MSKKSYDETFEDYIQREKKEKAEYEAMAKEVKMNEKILESINFPQLSRNELYRLSAIAVKAMHRLQDRLNEEERRILANKKECYLDLNHLSREELYKLCTIVVYAIRRLNKRLNEKEVNLKRKKAR